MLDLFDRERDFYETVSDSDARKPESQSNIILVQQLKQLKAWIDAAPRTNDPTELMAYLNQQPDFHPLLKLMRL